MTEDQIERRVERMMDHLDRVFLNGDMSQKNYDLAVADLRQWAEQASAANTLTAQQLVVLAHFACHDAKGMRLDGRWVWADDIRRDPKLAERFIAYTAEKELEQ